MSAICRKRWRACSWSSRTEASPAAVFAMWRTLDATLRPAMATPVTVPSLGEDDAPAVLIRFLVEPGQAVHRGAALYELETAKVTQDVEAKAGGVALPVGGTAR